MSLAEQTESAAAAHATLVRLARRLQSDTAELSECKAEAEQALDKARENEAQLRLRLQSSEEALSRAKAALEKARERHQDELRGLREEWEERREGEMARAAEEKEEITQVRFLGVLLFKRSQNFSKCEGVGVSVSKCEAFKLHLTSQNEEVPGFGVRPFPRCIYALNVLSSRY